MPSPISYVSLGSAGFSPERFGLVGRLDATDDGFKVTLARDTIAIRSTAYRPTTVPVVRLDSVGRPVTNQRPDRWVLLSSRTGITQGWSKPVFVAVGIALLLLSFYAAVATVPFRGQVPSRWQELWTALGITSLLALLLTRTVIGARVALFSPYLDRAMETVVGMWIAIPVVALGLLSWGQWARPLLTRSRLIASSRSPAADSISAVGSLIGHLLAGIMDLRRRSLSSAATLSWVLGVMVLGTVTVRGAVQGLIAAGMVLLAWMTVAWIIAFSTQPFPTFGTASAVIDSHTEPAKALTAGSSRWDRWRRWIGLWRPELSLVATSLVASIAVYDGGVGVLVGVVGLIVAVTFMLRGIHSWAVVGFGAAVFIGALGAVRSFSENGSLAAFVLVILSALVGVRIGRMVGARRERSTSGGTVFGALGLLVPLALLFPLTLLDMGLFLVMAIPLGLATLLAAGHGAMRGVRAWVFPVAIALILTHVVLFRVLVPPVEAIRRSPTHEAKAAAFERMSEVFGYRLPFVSAPFDRAAARGIATRDQRLAEQVLVAAAPGEARDLLMPSIEQIWGARAYSRAGLTGVGPGRVVLGNRGVATAVSYAENAFSVYILAEHGALGALLVLACYGMLAIAIGGLALTSSANRGGSLRASRALFTVGGLIVVIPAAYVALSNLGRLPITGQNMPFLGLNAWSDVAICAGVVGILVTGAIRTTEDAA